MCVINYTFYSKCGIYVIFNGYLAPSKVTSDMLERQHQNLQDEMKLLESDIEFLEEKIAKLHGEKEEFSGSGGARRESEQMDDEELESAMYVVCVCELSGIT